MRFRRAAAFLVTLALALTACGQATVPTLAPARSAAEQALTPKPTEAPKPAAAAAPAGYAVAPAAGQAAVAQPADAASAAKASDLAQTTVPTDKPWDRMIIRNGTLSIWVANVDRAVEQARLIAGKYDGFVSASNTRLEKVKVDDREEERQLATLTLQVPARSFDTAVQELRGLAVKVESEVGTSQDVTEEYVDLDANLRNLRRTEDAVAAMLARAQKLDEVMTLTRELTQIRGQIERIEGRKRFLERRSDFSTVTLNMQLPPSDAATPTPVRWDPAATAARGWNASLRVLRAIAEVVILAVSFGWWLVPLGLAGGYVLLRTRLRPRERVESS